MLVFDEPLSGLDVTTGLVFKSLIKALARQGKTILYSSHVLEVVEKVCTSVIILRKGVMVANDSVEHLRDLMELPSLEDIFSRAGAAGRYRQDRRRHRRSHASVGEPMPPALQNEVSQFRELARHFFGRFFDNDLVSADGDMRATVVNILAILSAPGMLLPFLFYVKYVNMADLPMYVRDLASLGEKEFFICFSMTVMGLVTVIEWEMLFPDRRDYRQSGAPPYPAAHHVRRENRGPAGVSDVFSLAINAFSPIMFPAVVTARRARLLGAGHLRAATSSAFWPPTLSYSFCASAVQGC